MNFQSHLTGGIIGFFIALAAFRMSNIYIADVIPLEPSHILLYFALFVYMSLFPDVDTDSRIENYTYGAAFVMIIALIYLQMDRYGAIFGAMLCIPKITTHRKLMHNPLTGASLACVVGWFAGADYGVFALGGFATHLILDL